MATGSQFPVMTAFEVLLLVPETVGVLLARGTLAVLFGILALAWPISTPLALALLFGVYALIDGAGLIFTGFRVYNRSSLWVNGLTGVLAIGMAVITMIWPGITVASLAALAGTWALLTGAGEILAAIRLRRQIGGELRFTIAGLISLVAGVLILVGPMTGVIGLATVLSACSLGYGTALIAMGFRLRSLARGLRNPRGSWG
jgi:uncharacterized membrane protein HdeD (DUF308 family)